MELQDILNTDSNAAPFDAEEIRNNLPCEFARYAVQNFQPQLQRPPEQNRQLVQALRSLVASQEQLHSNLRYNNTPMNRVQYRIGNQRVVQYNVNQFLVCSQCGIVYRYPGFLLSHLRSKHPAWYKLTYAKAQSNNIDKHAQT